MTKKANLPLAVMVDAESSQTPLGRLFNHLLWVRLHFTTTVEILPSSFGRRWRCKYFSFVFDNGRICPRTHLQLVGCRSKALVRLCGFSTLHHLGKPNCRQKINGLKTSRPQLFFCCRFLLLEAQNRRVLRPHRGDIIELGGVQFS